MSNYPGDKSEQAVVRPTPVYDVLVSKLSLSSGPARQYLGASLGFFSELIHLWLLAEQYLIFIGYGVVFLLIAIGQGIIGANLLFRPGRRLLSFGIWFNGLIVFTYVFTHTIGVVVGLAFLPLPLDGLGIVTALAEVVLILTLYFWRRDLPKVKKAKKVKATPHRK